MHNIRISASYEFIETIRQWMNDNFISHYILNWPIRSRRGLYGAAGWTITSDEDFVLFQLTWSDYIQENFN